jgi:integrase/recombinase XerD
MPSAKPVPPSATQPVPTLPVPRAPDRLPSTIATLAAIPEEEIRLQGQKIARTRRAYRRDVVHFLRTLAIATPAELYQVDHKAVIAWEGFMRESEGAAPSTVRRRVNPHTAARLHAYLELAGHGADLDGPMFRLLRPSGKRQEERRPMDPDAIDRVVRKFATALGLNRG